MSIKVKVPSARHKGVWGSERAAPSNFKLKNGRTGQFHVWVALPSGKESRYAFKRRFCGPQIWSGLCLEKRHRIFSNPIRTIFTVSEG